VRKTWHYLVVIGVLMATAVGLQVWRDRGWRPYEPATPIMWLRAGPAMKRALVGFDALVADIYWIRSVVYFGRQGQRTDENKNFDLLAPMLDLVTTLDPRFSVAYRFGAIFLSEGPPNGPGQPDLAVDLLKRGADYSPEKWEYLHDIGFVYYWHQRDFKAGARWLERASEIPGAPFWLKSTAAHMHSERGDRQSARMLWQQIRNGAENDHDMVLKTADLRLAQFDAMDAIDRLNEVILRFESAANRMPTDWRELVAARLLRSIPLDPTGVPYEIDEFNRTARVSERSALSPMPKGFTLSPRR
jgi:hypothetical protein